jgi:hypothetical protein
MKIKFIIYSQKKYTRKYREVSFTSFPKKKVIVPDFSSTIVMNCAGKTNALLRKCNLQHVIFSGKVKISLVFYYLGNCLKYFPVIVREARLLIS